VNIGSNSEHVTLAPLPSRLPASTTRESSPYPPSQLI